MKIRYVIAAALWIAVFGGCAAVDRQETETPTARPEPSETTRPDAPEDSPASDRSTGGTAGSITPDRPQFELVPFSDGPGTRAHAPYLDEEPEFTSIPSVPLPEAPYYALVASPVAEIHREGRLVIRSSSQDYMPPVAEIESERRSVPIGTVIPVYEVYETRLETNLVEFEGEYNYFYRSEYAGRAGYVFGADLLPGPGPLMNANEESALRRSPEVLERYAHAYTAPRRSPTWYDSNGLRSYSDAALARLSRDRFAYERVLPDEYGLGGDRPSDMISLYISEIDDRSRTIYLTADLFAHALHLVVHTALKTAEEFEIAPRLGAFLADTIATLEDARRDDRFETYEDARTLAIEYLQVGAALLDLAPVRNDGTFPVSYEDVDQERVLASYPPSVQAEVALILGAAGYEDSPLLGTREDYSQYRPRGHYTENGALSAYFRAMMWFGRVHFPISSAEVRVLAQPESAGDATRRLLPAAIVLDRVVRGNTDRFVAWREIFDPITVLIGRSDDVSFYDLAALDDLVADADLAEWLESGENLSSYIEAAGERLRAPQIAGNSVFYALSQRAEDGDGEPTVPRGFRLFGQRFTHDSFVHQLTSSPRIFGRMFVSGLDVFDAMGSGPARAFLGEDTYNHSFDELELYAGLSIYEIPYLSILYWRTVHIF
jgi:hypothetical protein